jgi:hypothetical protein
VPDKPFPSGNVPEAFHARMGRKNEQRLAEAKRNVLGALVIFLALIATLYAWFLR